MMQTQRISSTEVPERLGLVFIYIYIHMALHVISDIQDSTGVELRGLPKRRLVVSQ